MNIVLAHGILGFDQIGLLEYFNGVEKHLVDKHNAKVFTTKINPTGSIEGRGEQLKEQILDWLGKNGQPQSLNPDKETHIIAHSMGGLDSRYILSPQNTKNIAGLITSLTTVGTPHRGSPIADLLYPALDGKAHSKITKILENQIIESLEFAGISTKGLRDLTTMAMKQFNMGYGDSPDVKYFWTAGIGRSGDKKTSWPFLPTYKFIYQTGEKDEDKENDGVVPLSSANHGEQIGSLWNADHADEVGHDLDKYFSLSGALTRLAGIPRHDSGKDSPEGLWDRYDEIIARISPLKKTGR